MTQDRALEDPTIQAHPRMLEIAGIVQLLRGCVIPQAYSVPQDLVSCIGLTPLGLAMVDELRARHRRTRPNEAALAVALVIGVGDELLLDAERTDVDGLRTAVSLEVKRKRLLFPDPYQRSYAEELFQTHEFQSTVSAAASYRFLKEREQGVYQVGHTTVGPWGCVESDQFRVMEPNRRVFGFYCENGWCTRLHPFTFETADNAPVNRAQSDLRPILEEHRATSPSQRLREFQLQSAKLLFEDPFIDSSQLLNFIGDALSSDERTDLAVIALRNQLRTDPSTRARLSSLSSRVLSDPLQFVQQLSFGEVMQLLHILSDDLLVRSIDEAAFSGALRTESDLRRTARVDRWPETPFTAEVSTKGLRFSVAADKENVILGQLLHRVYANSPADLAFALDRPSNDSLDSLISFAFQSLDVASVADSCLINDRRAASAACRLLHLDDTNRTRAEIADLLKWRLGITNEVEASRSQTVIAGVEQYLGASAERSEEDKRGQLSNIYVGLETELMLAIRFAEWALGSDHYLNTPRFSFRLRDLPSTSRFLVDRQGVAISSRPTFQPLASSFARLADWLDGSAPVIRDPATLPAATLAAGRPFAFQHLSVFHDLTAASRDSLTAALRSATREFSDEDVVSVRNAGPGHGNNAFPEDDQIRIALTHVRRGIEILARSGLTPVVYERASMSSGLRGQSETGYESWAGSVSIRVPFWPLAPGLPSSSSHLIVMPGACGPGWGELRFKVPTGDRGGARWEDWPPRRRSERHDDWDAASDPAEAANESQPLTA